MFTKTQPKEGETIMHCGHILGDDGYNVHSHFFQLPGGVKFQRPDGTFGEATWAVCCDDCFQTKGSKFDIRGDGKWIGNEPIIKVNPNVN